MFTLISFLSAVFLLLLGLNLDGVTADASTTTPAPPPPPTVTTLNGKVSGMNVPLAAINPALPGSADWFFGIRYAQPPVGNLRLEKPLPVQNWNTTFDASNPLAALPCYNQHSPAPSLGLVWSEDCLKVNVYRPSTANATTSPKLPVLVYIHGGGWGVGGVLVEGPYGFNAFYVSQGIIVVQIAYRLTLLGFMSDGTSQLPGNLGLFDQRLALQWISQNIGAFGGDPNRITVWGQSAGAASVAFHSVTKESYNYFQQSIEMSGSFNNPWALSQKSITSGKREAKSTYLNCTNPATLKQCLKDADINNIQNALNLIPYADTDFNFVSYTPRYDGGPDGFFQADFETLVKAAPKKPTITSFTTDESIILTIVFPASAFNITSAWTVQNSSFGKQDLINFINNNIVSSIPLLNNSPQLKSIRNTLISLYVNSGVPSNANSTFYLERYTLLMSDIQFIVPMLWESRLKAQNGWPVYLYHFDHMDANLTAQIPYKAPQHTGEYPYTIGVNLFGSFNMDANDGKVSAQLVTGFANFVKTGSPNPSTPNWPRLSVSGNQCDNSNQFEAININPNPFVETPSTPSGALWVNRLAVWDSLAKKYNLNLLKSMPGTQKQCTGGLLGLIDGLFDQSSSSSSSSSSEHSFPFGK